MRAFYLAVLVLALAACNREGPAEKAGRSIDRAGEKASKGIENAAKSVRDAVTPDKK
jgi:predicted small lipoprotein YifL